MPVSPRLASAAHAGDLPRESRVPGGIAFVEIPGGDRRRRRCSMTHRAAVIRHDDRWVAIVGIPLATKPGPQTLQVATGSGNRRSAVPASTDKSYRTQHLTIKNQRQVEPASRRI